MCSRKEMKRIPGRSNTTQRFMFVVECLRKRHLFRAIVQLTQCLVEYFELRSFMTQRSLVEITFHSKSYKKSEIKIFQSRFRSKIKRAVKPKRHKPYFSCTVHVSPTLNKDSLLSTVRLIQHIWSCSTTSRVNKS